MIDILLTKGKTAIIDEDDFFLISQYRWWAKLKGSKWYAETKINGKNVSMHRFLTQAPKDTIVDHKDGDGLNNRRSNLRFATAQQNAWNTQVYPGRDFKGVSFRKDRGLYRAYITVENRYYHLGHFATAELAAEAYDKAAQELFGEFACLNEVAV
jgi:hypothetical protein